MTKQTKAYLLSLLFFTLIFVACQEITTNQQEKMATNTTTVETIEKKEKLLRHVVIFKFKDESSEEDVNKLNDAFNALADSISVIKGFEWGLNNNTGDLHQGFTHCYLITFASEEDKDSIYIPHPQHKAFVASLQPHLEKALVLDYWTNP